MCTPRDGGQVIVHSHELFDELLQHQIQNREIPDHHVKVLSVTLELHSPTILFMIISGSMYLSDTF